MQFIKRAWAEISISALEYNINQIKLHLPEKSELMAVVKADAYGHGHDVICHILEQNDVKYYAVSNLNEAVEVRKICPDAEILILGYTPPEYAQILEQYNIIQAVVSAENAKMLSVNAKKKIRCHIKLDTGMGRIGLRCNSPEETASVIQEIISYNNIEVEGIFTHFAVADTNTPECNEYTEKQKNFIVTTSEILKKRGVELKHVHFMNSAAIINHSDKNSTLGRAGIILYGLLPNYPEKLPVSFKPVMSLKSVVSHVKVLEPGVTVSYGRTYTTEKPQTKIATVTIGYADGYPRLLSNKGEVIIHGTRCPIVGRICMDQLMVDVSNVSATVKPNDEVTLIGTDGDEEITADELAGLIGTIGYEVVCGISKRVPRVVKY